MKPVVFIEGGGAPGDALTLPEPPTDILDLTNGEAIGTRQALAEAFYQLFDKAVPNLRVIFDISPNGGYKETIGSYVKARQNGLGNLSLMIDFQDIDGLTSTDKHQTIQSIADKQAQNRQIPIRPILADVIFFMVQKMDAWILSQPTVIDQEYVLAKRNDSKIQAKLAIHKQLKPHEIRNPDNEMGVLLGYYEEERKGQWKKLKYHKIKTVVRLLPRLNINQLQRDFDDVGRFVDMLRSISNQP